MVSIADAAAAARVEYLGKAGIIGVSFAADKIIFYVETQDDAYKVPSTYWGYPTEIIVSKRFEVF